MLVAGSSTSDAERLSPRDLPAGRVAVVTDLPEESGTITEAEFERALEQAAAQAAIERVPQPGDRKYGELKETALNTIFEIVWLEGQAAEMGISIGPREVEREAKRLKDESFQSDAEYEEFLTESRYTGADVERQVRAQVLSTKLQERIDDSVRTPTDSEIRAYYEEHKATQFTGPSDRGEPAQTQTLSEARPQIRRQLRQQLKQEEFNTFIEDYKEKWRARTICAPSFATERCANGKRPAEPESQ